MAFPPVCRPLARALEERGYTDPTPVQTAVLEADAEDRDLLVSAQTGSGKTIAYGLAIGATMMGDAEYIGPARDPLALIVAPTRELALQVHGELTWLYQYTGARIVYCVGGMDARREQRQLSDGAHIVVGTPGRLRDHLERGALKVSGLTALVLDEADEMLDLGFREDLEFILKTTPEDRRTLLFSATLPKPIVTLAQHYQNDAFRVQVTGSTQAHADIEYRAMRVSYNDVEHAVVNVLRFVEPPSALVFCNTRESVRHLQAILLERGFAAVALSGELSQSERNHALQALRDGRARVCVATDVAARGIDLPNLGLVIHADLPNDAQVLQHRSGRTGRAGRKGVSVLLIPPSRRRKAEQLLGSAHIQPVWSGVPTVDEIRQLDHERLLQNPIFTDPASEEDTAMAESLLGMRSAQDIAIAFSRLYRAQLPAPEDMTDAGSERPRNEPRERREKREPRERRERGAYEGASHERSAYDHGSKNSVWFRLDVGRTKNADPKWLVPMLCRKGKITKQDIGKIKISDDETKFEILEHAAEKFAAAARNSKGGEGNITLLGASPGEFAETRRPRPDTREAKPQGYAPREHAPREDRAPRDQKPREHKPRERTDYKSAGDETPRKPWAKNHGGQKPGDGQKYAKNRHEGAPSAGGYKGKSAEGGRGEKPAYAGKKDFGGKKDFAPRGEKPGGGKRDFGGKKDFGGGKKFGKPGGFGGKHKGGKPSGPYKGKKRD